MTTVFAPSADLGATLVIVALIAAGSTLALLSFELWRTGARGKNAVAVGVSGALAVLGLLGAVLRPVRVTSQGLSVGPRVVVLVDSSRSMLLPRGKGSDRLEARNRAVSTVHRSMEDARSELLLFGDGPPERANGDVSDQRPHALRSDLVAALSSLQSSADEPPSAIVIVSDGRFDRPGPDHVLDRSTMGLSGLEVPVHTVAVAKEAPRDATIRSVALSGAAVAHQPFAVRVEVGCSGGLSCGTIPVEIRELLDRGPAQTLARGEVTVTEADDGAHAVELSITLHRAGPRVIEVVIDPPAKDEIEENDRRFLTLDVARDRVRVLHIAGRPTYDVRAMRTWLKADESVDVVAFFILRTPTDSVGARPSELALIPFPVDELFTTHLPSFDAVVLQDFNAREYGLTKHLDNLSKYVSGGGGLIMVGGPDAFSPGRYAGTALAKALPVQLLDEPGDGGVDLGSFQPGWTAAGRVAPVLGPLRDVVAEGLPDMPGTNVVGAPNPGATVLWTHPTLEGGGAPMPVLSLGEFGTGRTIALTVDGTHRLLMGGAAVEHAGRAYGALWDGLLGWLMRDPRFESTAIDLKGGCVAGEPAKLVLRPLPGHEGRLTLTVLELGSGDTAFETSVPVDVQGGAHEIELPALEAGGYAASVRIGAAEPSADAKANLTPATRRDFACERGGDEWADPRPDPKRLRDIAAATGGKAFDADEPLEIPLPKATIVNTHRSVAPILPAWGWTALAALLVGAHWIVRRRAGLA